MDYSLLCRKAPTINKNYGFSLPVPPVTLGIGIFVLVLLITGVMLGCYMYQMGKTFRVLMETVKKVTEKSISGCRLMFSRVCNHIEPISYPRTM